MMQKTMVQKVVIVGLLGVAVAVFFAFDLGRFLTLDYLKQSRTHFQSLLAVHPFAITSIYMAVYIAVTALSLPGAAVLTLAGGALFGLGSGTVIVSFASTIGATLACIVARFLLRDWVENRFGDKLQAINKGIDEEGPFYLFTLRLIPVFPFFVINLAMGLTSMRVVTFYWISQIGMLPGTIVYVNAGKELARIDSLAGILSPALVLSFVLLGVFPLVAKKIISLVRHKTAWLDKEGRHNKD